MFCTIGHVETVKVARLDFITCLCVQAYTKTKTIGTRMAEHTVSDFDTRENGSLIVF